MNRSYKYYLPLGCLAESALSDKTELRLYITVSIKIVSCCFISTEYKNIFQRELSIPVWDRIFLWY